MEESYLAAGPHKQQRRIIICLPAFPSHAIRESTKYRHRRRKRQTFYLDCETVSFEANLLFGHKFSMASIRPTASAAAAQLLRTGTISETLAVRRPMLSSTTALALRRWESSLTPGTPQAAARVAPSTADNAPDYQAATDRATSYVMT